MRRTSRAAAATRAARHRRHVAAAGLVVAAGAVAMAAGRPSGWWLLVGGLLALRWALWRLEDARVLDRWAGVRVADVARPAASLPAEALDVAAEVTRLQATGLGVVWDGRRHLVVPPSAAGRGRHPAWSGSWLACAHRAPLVDGCTSVDRLTVLPPPGRPLLVAHPGGGIGYVTAERLRRGAAARRPEPAATAAR